MALAKVSLISELSLLPLKRMIQRTRGDSHQHQQATEAYCAQLRDLYRSSLRERRRAHAKLRRARKEAGSLSEEGFKLTVGQDGAALLGITLERASLPLAEQNDKVQLLRLAPDSANGDQAQQELLARGTVTLVTRQHVRIKFQEPLKGSGSREGPREEEESRPNREAGDSKPADDHQEPARAEETIESQQGPEEAGKPEELSGEEAGKGETERQEPEVIHFKIRFDLNDSQPEEEVKDDDSHVLQLLEEVLRNFSKLKCNQALHKNLLGLYDERSDLMINERARVLTALGSGAYGELRIKPNGQQRAAVEQALKRRLTLIEGPAGSGKTLVAALIAANACRLRQSRVLVCSPLQTTVDKLTGLLLSLVGDLQVIRLPEDANAPSRSNLRVARLRKGSSRPRSKRCDSYVSQLTMAVGDIGDMCDADELASHSSEEARASEAADRCHLDRIVDDEIYLRAYARSKDTLGVHNHEQLHAHAYRMVTSCAPHKRRETELKMISSANVVCCTLVQAGSYLLKSNEFDLLVLDDQHVTSELDSLIAIMARGVKQLTLVSDTRRRIRLARSRLSTTHYNNQQVGQPVSSNGKQQVAAPNALGASRTASRNSDNSSSLRRANNGQNSSRSTPSRSRKISESSSDQSEHDGRAGLTSSQTRGATFAATSKCPPRVSLEPGNLFERLLSLGLPTVDMRVQYRCHATLANFFNHHFYAGRLKNDRRTNEKLTTEINSSLMLSEENFSWLPNRKYLTALFQVTGGGTSADNQHDAQQVEMLETRVTETLDKLLICEHIQESRIGVIYNRRSLLNRALKNSTRSSDLKMSTIDGFIGQERDFIILVAGSCSIDKLSGPDNDAVDARSYLGLTSEINCDFRIQDTTLNWAITRAKLGLFIVAGANYLQSSDTNGIGSEATSNENSRSGTQSNSRDCGSWRELVKYYADNELIVTCPALSV